MQGIPDGGTHPYGYPKLRPRLGCMHAFMYVYMYVYRCKDCAIAAHKLPNQPIKTMSELYICMYICMYVCMYVHTLIETHTHTHTHKSTHIYSPQRFLTPLYIRRKPKINILIVANAAAHGV